MLRACRQLFRRSGKRMSFARLEPGVAIAIELLEDRLHAKGSCLRSLGKGHTTLLEFLIRPLAVVCRKDGSRIFPDQVREPRSQDDLQVRPLRRGNGEEAHALTRHG